MLVKLNFDSWRFALIKFDFCRFTSIKFDFFRFTICKYAFFRFTPIKFDSSRFALIRSAFWRFVCNRCAPCRFAPANFASFKVTTQVPKTTIQGTSLCRDYLGHGGYCNQTGNLTAECAERRRGGNKRLNASSVPMRPPRLFFLPESTESQSGDQSTYLSSYLLSKHSKSPFPSAPVIAFLLALSHLFLCASSNTPLPEVHQEGISILHQEPVFCICILPLPSIRTLSSILKSPPAPNYPSTQ
uniref:Uncharacterized protein n=1 Tax=uncultured Methanosarcinales archaeon TaxID=183757 RepID=A0A7H1KNV5_9EURY|nr:hypothetical protein BFFPPMPJ_00024 [uncultured Methanosarcinales archaeon]